MTATAGIGKSTFYRHYRDKYDLLNSLVLDISNKTFQLREADYQVQLQTGLKLLKNNMVLFQNALKYQGQNSTFFALQEQARQYVHQLILGHHSLAFTNQFDFAIKFYCYGMVGTIRDWLYRNCDLSAFQLASQITDQMPTQLQQIILPNGTNL